jgi:hypothetical protein
MMEGLRKPTELIVIVITRLSYGCPLQAIVQAIGLDERTMASWRDRAGHHCQRLHQAVVEQASLDLVHVQADEIRVKGRRMTGWMGLAMMVSTRLWLAGVVSLTRDTQLSDRLLAPSAPVCSGCAPTAGLHRRMGGVSGQHSARLWRQDQTNRWARAKRAGRLARPADRHGDQTHETQARG